MVYLKSQNEIEHMVRSGQILIKVFEELERFIKPGISTKDIDRIVEKKITELDGIPSFKGYNGFPASACVSVNSEVIHGIPSAQRKLVEGDIVSVDIGAILNGYHSDAARTYPVGNIAEDAKKLISVTKESFFEGIKYAKRGNRMGDISSSIQAFTEAAGFSVVREYTGHGIGKDMHEDPEVPNYGKRGRGMRLERGMALAIEPMINMGGKDIDVLDDEWTVVTCDNSLSAHYENTVIIIDENPIITTFEN